MLVMAAAEWKIIDKGAPKGIQRRPLNRAMVNRSTRIFVQILLSTERNGLLLSKIPPLIVQLGPYNRSIESST